MTKLREITKRQFDAYCYIRTGPLKYLGKEVAWFEAFNKKILATVFMDFTDEDYGFVILGRDKRKVFRLIAICEDFYADISKATKKLQKLISTFENDGKEFYAQGDEVKLPNEILVPQEVEEKLHPYFKYLITEDQFEAARNLIKEIVYTYVDVDGNYIKSFQTSGFDARLWELYLYVFLHNAGFKIDSNFQAPDYCISYFDQELTIEAVTVNANPAFDEPAPTTLIHSHILSLDYMPIKFGSSLYSKLQKKYWEKEHVKNKPFVLAIHDYHIPADGTNPGSMTWSRSALADYLYGYRMKVSVNEDGTLTNHVIKTKNSVKPDLEKIETHTWKGKTIPSGFFFQPDSENVSAVLFSNSATITTFNRMGKLAGLGGAKIKMMRIASLYNPDPMATTPIIKSFDIDDPSYEEAWSDGLIMYHNPKAKFPIDPDLFPEISHMFFNVEKEELFGIMHPYDVLSSQTVVFIETKSK